MMTPISDDQPRAAEPTEKATSRLGNLRICRIVPDYPVAGNANYGLQPVFYYLSREQVRLGHEVHVVTRRNKSQPAHEVYDGVVVHRVEGPFTLGAARLLRELTNTPMDSVVHTHSTSGLFMSALRRVSKRSPLISHVHGTTRSPFAPMTLKFGSTVLDYSPMKVTTSYLREKALWSTADGVAAVSKVVKRDLISYYGLRPEKIAVTYNGIDATLFRPRSDGEIPNMPALNGKKIVLYVGHFGLRKGIFHLLGAMKRVTREVPDAVLVCIGGVPDWLGKTEYWSQLDSLIKGSGLSDKVFMLDRVPNSTLPAYYSACSVFVLPSYYEAFAKVVLEAMGCGKPVITSTDGGPSEAVVNGKAAGILVPYGSETGLADALITLLQDERLAKEMGRNGRERIEKDFTWPIVARRIDSMYQAVLN
jgi:glycosyltransferase involved in cell wall biosynthesis